MNDGNSPAKPASWMELIVLLGILGLVVWLAFARPPGADQDHDLDKAGLAAHATLLEQQLQDFHAKASHYLDNAPREYDAYFRDTAISHPHMQIDVQSLDRAVQVLIESGPTADEGEAQRELTENPQLNESPVFQLGRQWKDFREGLDEQLGVDPEMPRLEWGTRHITEELNPIIATVAQTRQQWQASSASTGATTAATPAWAWPALAAWLLLILIWFGWRVRGN